MDSDVLMVVGVISAALALPALFAAYSESRFPRGALGLGVIAAVLILLAIQQKPSGYSIAELPTVFARVFGKLLN